MNKTMRIRMAIGAMAALLMMVTGCAYAVSPVTGGVYNGVKGPIEATDNTVSSAKTGKASCTSILGLVGYGDCSIDAAAKEAGIEKIRRVDFESKNIIFVYAKFTTVVTGE